MADTSPTSAFKRSLSRAHRAQEEVSLEMRCARRCETIARRALALLGLAPGGGSCTAPGGVACVGSFGASGGWGRLGADRGRGSAASGTGVSARLKSSLGERRELGGVALGGASSLRREREG